MVFKDFKALFQKSFALMLTGHTQLYQVGATGDQIWDTYLAAFPEEERAGYNCNCCRQFIKHYGNVVVLEGNQIKTFWDFTAGGYYQQVVDALRDLVLSTQVRDVFVATFAKLGTDTNVVQLEDKTTTVWNHLFVQLPVAFVTRSSESAEAIKGHKRTGMQVLKRALDEIPADATQTVLELIAQNSIYRGAESNLLLTKFLSLQKAYALLTSDQKRNFCWKALSESEFIARIRNSAMGTLLVDIAEGTDLDVAVTKFERMMAPTNYKRPTAIFTQAMLKKAQEQIADLGLDSALGRRHAQLDDVSVNNVLFVSSHTPAAGVFADLAQDVAVNPKTFSKLETISLSDFLEKVLPHSTQLEVLLENKHEPNLVSLIAPLDPEAKPLFKWNNNFSWSYNNALTDSIKEKVKSAGGKVEGLLRISLAWFNMDDLDLHLHFPSGEHIYYAHKYTMNGANLDVDMNAGGGMSTTPVENIIFPYGTNIQEGKYRIGVNQFNRRNTTNVGYSLEVEYDGELFEFNKDKSPSGTDYIEFSYSKKDGIVFSTGASSSARSKEIWGLSTNRFQKVNMLMRSPNFWDNQSQGNEHVFFMLDKAKNTGVVRGFFNEFLSSDLQVHRKVFEALGSKLKVAEAPTQLSGVGFSTTQDNEFICRVTGKVTRTLKVLI